MDFEREGGKGGVREARGARALSRGKCGGTGREEEAAAGEGGPCTCVLALALYALGLRDVHVFF